MEGRPSSTCGSRLTQRRAHPLARSCSSFSDGGRARFDMWLSPRRHARSFFERVQQLRGWGAAPFQNAALAPAQRTLVAN
eukprot:5159548-Pyramimonas_sp.AAC.1